MLEVLKTLVVAAALFFGAGFGFGIALALVSTGYTLAMYLFGVV